ncbi:MAG: hypothetical protein ACRDRN_01345 [Sciscionella sp.]
MRAGDREWLWRREEPRRDAVRPGDAFVDAGGIEECLPTVRGEPDHGDAWSRRWRRPMVIDGTDRLTFRVYVRPGFPASMALWRNLGGFPEAAAYRSIGVEPMLGEVLDLADAEDADADAVIVPTSGELAWRLGLCATRAEEPP